MKSTVGSVRCAALLAILSAGAASTGCRAIALPFMMWGAEPTKPVAAEYPHLQDKKVLILVWAEMDTQFEHPFVQLEVSEHIRQELELNIRGASVVANRQVVDMQQREPDWERQPPAAIGKRFGADRVLMVELTEYTTREPDSPHLFRGRITASVKVYDTAYPNSAPAYKTVVEIAHPENGPAPWGSDDRSVRLAAMQEFARQVVGKFYDRKVKVK